MSNKRVRVNISVPVAPQSKKAKVASSKAPSASVPVAPLPKKAKVVSSKASQADPPPRVPSANQWIRAPYVLDYKMFWRSARASSAAGGVHDPLLLAPDASPSQGDALPASSVIRFCVERGDFPSSAIHYAFISRPLQSMSLWVAHVMGDSTHRSLLEKSKLLKAIVTTTRLDVPFASYGRLRLDHFVSRWSTSTHTFVLTWGRFR